MKVFDFTVVVLISLAATLLIKQTSKKEFIVNFAPFIYLFAGAVCSPIVYFSAAPQVGFLSVIFFGFFGGFTALGIECTAGQLKNLFSVKSNPGKKDAAPRVYITGDKHRHFKHLIAFCKKESLTKKDTVIILGDACFNYFGDLRDIKLKRKLRETEVTLFCIYGNKENRPENIPTYGIRTYFGGIVYYEPRYPNLLFARDGEVYTIGGKKFFVMGGAHSVDKLRRKAFDLPFWEDEMPDEELKEHGESVLAAHGNKVYGFLTHTCPISVLPTEMFVSTREENPTRAKKKKKKSPYEEIPLDIDRSTEEWLEKIKKKTEFEVWYCGHYHIDKELGKIRMMHKEILPLFEDKSC